MLTVVLGDEQRPACARCEKAGVDCIRAYSIRFRHGVAYDQTLSPSKADFGFHTDQPWVNTARSLTFLDQTPELISIYDHAAEPDDLGLAAGRYSSAQLNSTAFTVTEGQLAAKNVPAELPDSGGTDPTAPPGYTPLSSPTKRRRLTIDVGEEHSLFSGVSLSHKHASEGLRESTTRTGWTPLTTIDDHEPSAYAQEATSVQLEQINRSAGQSYAEMLNPLPSIHHNPVWPLQHREEARLLRYYIENLSQSFDLTDPLRHFRNVVPKRAARCPPLFNAILALSAKHLSRIGEYDSIVSDHYHQQCLAHLIPMLNDDTAILDENLLASTIILRHLEEIEVPLSGQSPESQQSHLLGAHAFISAQEKATSSGGLRHAAFWVGLRQEIYVAFVNQRSIIPALTHCNIDRSLDPAEDHVWACRMVVLCADVIRFCFGDGDQSKSTYSFLMESVEQWNSCKPASYVPLYENSADAPGGKYFPEIWYVGDEVLVAMQHYHVARILLASFNPCIPRLGPSRTASLKAMDDEIRDHVRKLCGICLTNASTRAIFTYASMGVTMAGDKFIDRGEQEALLEVLYTCDKQHAWPTGTAVNNLKHAWGWQEVGEES